MKSFVPLTGLVLGMIACRDTRSDSNPAPTANGPAQTSAPESRDDAETTGQPEDVTAAVEHLLACVQSSSLVFIRNDEEHTGTEAATHIRRKYDHYRKQIATPEDFVSKAATKSELSGKPYLVKLADGRKVLLAEWLSAKLAEWRASPVK